MTPATLAYLVAVLFLAVALLDVTVRRPYSCPACGAKRVDKHSAECPWSGKR